MRLSAPLLALTAAVCLIGCGDAGSSASGVRRTHAQSARSKGKRSGTHGLETVTVTSGGHRRKYLLYVPPGNSPHHRLPLVLVYHGAGDTAHDAATQTDLLAIAERRHDFILAYLQGYDYTWNEGAGDTPAHQAGIDDVSFTTTVLRRIESSYDVDLQRVVATGFSNGALMTQLLGCRLARYLTMIAPVEGELPVSISPGCAPSAPISVLEIHGTADQSIPYAGGRFFGIGGGTTVLSAPASAARWAALDGCTSQGQNSRLGSSVFTHYGGCRNGVTVDLDSVQGGQHDWPPNFGQRIATALASLPTGRHAAVP